jgi:hypothetical protein
MVELTGVRILWDSHWHDGPVSGLAEYEGQHCWFQAVWDDALDQWSHPRKLSNRKWLLDQGFLVEVEQEEAEVYWAHLASIGSPSRRMAPKYGRSTTSDEPVGSSRQRYEVEELGIGSSM